MATSHATLADVAKTLDPDGSSADIAEILSQSNQIIDDMPWIEGNLPTGHRASVRSTLPAPTWRRMNQGVDGTKSTSMQIEDSCGLAEAISEVDVEVANLNGNSAKWRLGEDKAFIEGISQDMAQKLFYANSTLNPEQPHGLAPRYGTLQTAVSQSANNVLSGGGSGSANASIWLVGWAEDKVTGIFPKGTKAGIDRLDRGTEYAFDASNRRFLAYITHYKWRGGLHVKDWRYAVRICNVDVTSAAGGLKSTAPIDLVDLVDQAISRIPNLEACRPALYMNRTVRRYFNKQRNYGAPSSSTVNLTTIRRTDSGDERGVIKRFDTYDGIPIRTVDQLLNTEATVS